jgi:hypothetical protein
MGAPSISLLPSTVGPLLWLSMLAYFLVWYSYLSTTDKGRLQKCCGSGTCVPTISLIGSQHIIYFRTNATATALCIATAYIPVYNIFKNVPLGKRWRRAQLMLAALSATFLVALSFVSITDHARLHRILTSCHMWLTVCMKACDIISFFMMRRLTIHIRPAWQAKMWKRCTSVIGLRTCDRSITSSIVSCADSRLL